VKMLFFTFGPDVVASSRTRVYQYLPFFQKDGIICKVIPAFTGIPYKLIAAIPADKGRGKLLRLMDELYILFGHVFNACFAVFQTARVVFTVIFFSFDLVFVQKVFLPLFVLRALRFFRVKLIFDFDDAIYTQQGIFRNRKRFDKMISLYDLIILENNETAQYSRSCGNSNIIIITGPIDTDRYRAGEKCSGRRVTIGWIGSPTTQKNLCLIKNVCASLCDKYPNLDFVTIGAGNLDFEGVSLIQKKWALETEVSDMQIFDIGIMPLSDDEWSRGKGGYKLLQYMSLGIPCCTSPVGINKVLVEEGRNGFLVETEAEWYEKLSFLIEDDALRMKMGVTGRRMAENLYSFDAAYPKLKQALIKLL
jgi:glycosyltransferase involved in cell wall biosynthesis